MTGNFLFVILLNAAAFLKYFDCDHYQAFVSDFFFHLRAALVLRFVVKQTIYKKLIALCCRELGLQRGMC